MKQEEEEQQLEDCCRMRDFWERWNVLISVNFKGYKLLLSR